MLRTLRRLTLLPSLLFLALPGTGGLVVQALHHCATAAPWTAVESVQADQHDGPGHHAGHGTGHDSQGQEQHPCQCVGACAAPSAAAPVAQPVALHAAPAVARLAGALPVAAGPRPTHPPHFLPLANAPPVS